MANTCDILSLRRGITLLIIFFLSNSQYARHTHADYTLQPVYAIFARGQASLRFPLRAQSYWVFKCLDSAVIRTQSRTRIFSRPTVSLAEASSPLHRACTLLQKTRTFLPRAFEPGESLEFWNRVLSEFPTRYSANLQIVGECPNEIHVM
jgi:hypothetical protein